MIVSMLALAAGVGGVLAARRARARAERRRVAAEVVALGGDLARSVRSGCTLAEALERAAAVHSGPLAVELGSIQARLARGASLDAALASSVAPAHRGAAGRSARRRTETGPPERSPWCSLVRACRLGLGSSGDLAAVIDGAVTSLTDELELADETAALTAQARASVWVLAALPILGVAVFTLVDARVADVLLSTGPGRVCLVVGLSLDAAGLWTARRLVDRAVR